MPLAFAQGNFAKISQKWDLGVLEFQLHPMVLLGCPGKGFLGSMVIGSMGYFTYVLINGVFLGVVITY